MPRFLFAIAIVFLFNTNIFAAPCYGPTLPLRNKLTASLESYSLFKRYLEDGWGKVRSQQQFYGMSYGVFDWLSIDLKAGGGNIKQHPVGRDEVDYTSSFAGGYGIRWKFWEGNNMKAVLGFQHISVHPKSTHLGNTKNKAILDDWQWSVLGAYHFKKATPYIGTRWSRVDYIHWVDGVRKRRMSDGTKSIGLIYGLDFFVTPKIWLNLEGQSFDSDAFAFSINYGF